VALPIPLKAMGVLIYLMSMEEDQEVSSLDIARRFGEAEQEIENILLTLEGNRLIYKSAFVSNQIDYVVSR
jgi:DNA-binding IscR family transcriptional regulator